MVVFLSIDNSRSLKKDNEKVWQVKCRPAKSSGLGAGGLQSPPSKLQASMLQALSQCPSPMKALQPDPQPAEDGA